MSFKDMLVYELRKIGENNIADRVIKSFVTTTIPLKKQPDRLPYSRSMKIIQNPLYLPYLRED